MTLLTRVKARLAIQARRKVRGLLEGEYTSVFHGRSIDFDDVRQYVPGDSMADIDWRATARVGAPMTRRYIASRKHTLLIVADTARTMAATAESGDRKIDLAVNAAGALGYLATRHGDLVGLIAGDSDSTVYRAPASTEAHLERLLQLIVQKTSLEASDSGLERSLNYVARAFRKRMILLVIGDDRALSRAEIEILGRLTVQHEILWLTIADADPTRREWIADEVFDVAAVETIPAILRSSRSVRASFVDATRERIDVRDKTLEKLQISSARLGSADEVMACLYALIASTGSRSRRRSARPSIPAAAPR